LYNWHTDYSWSSLNNIFNMSNTCISFKEEHLKLLLSEIKPYIYIYLWWIFNDEELSISMSYLPLLIAYFNWVISLCLLPISIELSPLFNFSTLFIFIDWSFDDIHVIFTMPIWWQNFLVIVYPRWTKRTGNTQDCLGNKFRNGKKYYCYIMK
jgi:hypothetical protein